MSKKKSIKEGNQDRKSRRILEDIDHQIYHKPIIEIKHSLNPKPRKIKK
ncbi:hypothetical protein V7654_18795 [Bacillus sp. JJ1609]